MKIAITGGYGYIGSKLAERLLDEGHDIIILDINRDETKISLDRCRFIQCDITNYEHYTMVEMVEEFCLEVPCFFKSYYHLHLLFKHRVNEADKAMFNLRTDLQLPPAAKVQTKLARIIHAYFVNLPWY